MVFSSDINEATYSLSSAIEHITSLHQQAIELISVGDFDKARPALDRIRVLRSLFLAHYGEVVNRLRATRHSDEMAHLRRTVETNTAVSNTLQDWRKQFADYGKSLLESQDTKEISLGLDITLPEIWNFNNDVILIAGDNADHVITCLEERGQKNIIQIFEDDNVDTALKEVSFFTQPQVLILSCKGSLEHQSALQKAYDDLVKNISQFNTIEKYTPIVVKQHIQNLTHLQKFKNVKIADALRSEISGKNVIVASPGPSLRKNIELLRNLPPETILLAPAQSFQALAKHQINPDYIVIIDHSDYSDVLKNIDPNKVKGLVAAETCHPSFLAFEWNSVFIIPHIEMPQILGNAMGSNWRPAEYGASVSVQAVALCCEFKATAVAVVGQDLAVDQGTYYNRSDRMIQEEHSHLSKRIPIKGYYGGTAYTRSDYYLYLRELEFLASTYSEKCQLLNCTEGGAFIDGWQHEPLDSFLLRDAISSEEEKAISPLERMSDDWKAKVSQAMTINIERTQKILKQVNSTLKLITEVKSKPAKMGKLEKAETQLNADVASLTWLNSLTRNDLLKLKRDISEVTSLSENLALSARYYRAVKEQALELLELLQKKGQ
jgi:hypothetical protein